MKTILLTGATGFLGSHILNSLLNKGYIVIITKRTTSDCYRISDYLDKIVSYNTDQIELDEIFQNHRIDTIIHTATCYGKNGESDYNIFNSNLLFSINLLDCAVKFGIQAFFNTDTFFNDDKLNYQYLNSYTLSKKQFVEWGKRYSDINNLKFINMKLHHVYGSLDDTSKFIGWFVNQLKQGISEIRLTDGTQKRDFVHVADVVSAYLLIIEKIEEMDSFELFEVGTGNPVSLRDFLFEILHSYEKKLGIIINSHLHFGAIPMRVGEPDELKANNEKLISLGWVVGKSNLTSIF